MKEKGAAARKIAGQEDASTPDGFKIMCMSLFRRYWIGVTTKAQKKPV
jgi:hypothetical protein